MFGQDVVDLALDPLLAMGHVCQRCLVVTAGENEWSVSHAHCLLFNTIIVHPVSKNSNIHAHPCHRIDSHAPYCTADWVYIVGRLCAVLYRLLLCIYATAPTNSHKARHVIQAVNELIELSNVVCYRWALWIQLPQMFLEYLTNACMKNEQGAVNHTAMVTGNAAHEDWYHLG